MARLRDWRRSLAREFRRRIWKSTSVSSLSSIQPSFFIPLSFFSPIVPTPAQTSGSTKPHLSTMVQISEVKGNSRENRTAAHTHIKGLGLRSDGTSEATGDGFVGQATAREVRDSSKTMETDPFDGEPRLTARMRSTGMRCGSRPHQSKENGRPGCPARRWPRYRKDCARSRRITGIGNQGSFLPHRWQRDLLCRGQEDGGVDGKFPTSDRYAMAQ